MRRWQLRLATSVIVACAISAAPVAAASPSSLLASILAAARAQRSVHYVSTARIGAIRVDQVGDVGATAGIQRITYSKAGTTGQVTVVVSARTAYFRGDAFVLVNYMGFKPAAAAKYANAWILVPHTDRDFAPVAGDVTLPSVIAGLKGPGKPRAAPGTTIDGRRVVGVQWHLRAGGRSVVARLYARATGRPLPIEERATRGGSLVRATFSRWNEPIHVTAPNPAVPISTTGLE